jgi:hypothetical protein
LLLQEEALPLQAGRMSPWDSECRKKGDYKEMALKEYIDYLEAEIYSLSLVEKKKHYLYNLLEGLKAFRNNM